VLREACLQAMQWRRIPIAKDLSVGVNVSAYQVCDNRFVAEVEAALRDSGLPPAGLILELTESAFLSDTARVHHRLARLRELGVRIAIDDFGTGYSSLSYLRRLPIDLLKIDRAFVSELGASSSAQARSLVRSRRRASSTTCVMRTVISGRATCSGTRLLPRTWRCSSR
jgi:EAL domain-containing protein (putative c-di-GMP-specific phosphodiesterase class I)